MLVDILRRISLEPQLIPVVLAKFWHRFSIKRHRRRVNEYVALAVPPDEGMKRVLGIQRESALAYLTSDSYRDLMDHFRRFTPRVPGMGGAAFMGLCYVIARAIKPETVLETGVARGYSTAAILQALEDNSHGRLFSVDLPFFHPEAPSHTGSAIPEHLKAKGNWQLNTGPDRRILPKLLERIVSVDFFHYDSDKSYEGMMRTWALVWSHLSPGAIFVADDIHAHDAFLDFCESLGLPPVVIPKPPGNFYIGLLRKPER
jgi:hypothetical protein